MTEAENRGYRNLAIWGCLAAAAGLAGLTSLRGFDVDWPVVAMVVMAASASGLGIDFRGRAAGVRLSLVHPVLFGCAITMGWHGAIIPAAVVGVCRVLSRRESHSPLYRLVYDLTGPVAATTATSLVYALLGADPMRPHSVDSALPLLCAAAVYASSGALMFGAACKAAGVGEEGPSDAKVVAAGWSLSLLAGYVLAIVYAVAPVYALYAVSATAVWSATALGAERKPTQAVSNEPSKPEKATNSSDESLFVDPDTGLATRRYLDMFIEREAGRSLRFGKPLSVAVFSIDGFRNLDPETGRSILAAVGNCLSEGIREYDIVALHSEGRIVLVLPETPTTVALEVVDRLRGSVTAGIEKSVHVSVGLASYPEHGANADEIINAAHYALNRGRGTEPDRVHIPEDLAKAS